MKRDKEVVEENIAFLKSLLTVGDVIYTAIRSVSRSRESRTLYVYVVKNGMLRNITISVAVACGFSLNRDSEALSIRGHAMDMGFALVYGLGRTLYPDGFTCAGKGICKSNEHFNGDEDYEPHHHTDGGYAFKQVWA